MFRALLGLDETQEISGAALTFRGSWVLALVLVAAAIAFTIYLYRSEDRLSKGRRMFVAACQLIALLLIVLIVLGPAVVAKVSKPYKRTMLVLLDTSRSMAITDARSTVDDVGEAARVTGKISLGATPDGSKVGDLGAEVAEITRLDLARATLDHPQIKLIEKLSDEFEVGLFSFDSNLEPEVEVEAGKATTEDRTEDEGNDGQGGANAWLAALPPDGETSRVGSAIDEAVARYTGRPLAGVVVLSDFAWVEGTDPSKIAKRLKERGIPVYTVPIGLAKPPDIHVRGVIGPAVVFKGDHVPLRVKIESSGYEGRTVELSMDIEGGRVENKQVELRGGIQFEEMMFFPDTESGTVEIDFAVSTLAGETTEVNNRAGHNVRIIDEKIKVLYIEGMPRWEYRYLRWVLLRDPRLDVTFLMTQGDAELPATSPRHVSRFPQDRDEVLKYDLIIVGDVPSSFFSTDQMDQVKELVKERGGSLLMVAGSTSAPSSYGETPIADILPVYIGSGRWEAVGEDVFPVVTPAGRESLATSLSMSPDVSDRIWKNVRPMHALPDLDGAKPGATVLLSLPKDAEDLPDYPLVAWQRYGTGKSLFVATEDLWRMRLEVGDRFHARFWGQTIQFLTLSRLLGENRQITVETGQAKYSSGDQVRIFTNVLTESFEPVSLDEYAVVVEQKGEPDSSVEIVLTPVTGTPGLFTGSVTAGEDGIYILRTKSGDSEISNTVEYTVETIPAEDRETGARPGLGRQVAELSGGKHFAMSALGQLPVELGEEGELLDVASVEKELWDAPLIFLLILIFTGLEWYFRRKDNLV